VLSAAGLVVIAIAGEEAGLLAGTVVLASGVAFMFPGLMALAVARVDETERGSVVGTTSAFLDLSFGLAPAVLGVVAGATGYAAAFGLSAGVALVGAALLFLRRDTIVRPALATTGRLPG
jgi:predicted MFS family arabinose efflux permease